MEALGTQKSGVYSRLPRRANVLWSRCFGQIKQGAWVPQFLLRGKKKVKRGVGAAIPDTQHSTAPLRDLQS